MLERHIANVSNIAGIDQVTLTIMQSFEIYVYEITTDARVTRFRCQKTSPAMSR